MNVFRRWDLGPAIGLTLVSVVLLLFDKIDGLTFTLFLLMGLGATIASTVRMRSQSDDDSDSTSQ